MLFKFPCGICRQPQPPSISPCALNFFGLSLSLFILKFIYQYIKYKEKKAVPWRIYKKKAVPWRIDCRALITRAVQPEGACLQKEDRPVKRLHSLLRMPSSRWFNCFNKPSLPCSALERACSSENRCVHMASPKRQCLHKRFLS